MSEKMTLNLGTIIIAIHPAGNGVHALEAKTEEGVTCLHLFGHEIDGLIELLQAYSAALQAEAEQEDTQAGISWKGIHSAAGRTFPS